MHRRILFGVVVAVAIWTTGCSAGAVPGPTTSSPPPTPSGSASASACVPDPDAVIARTDPLPVTPMPAALVTTIDAAAQAGFAEAAAPGAIVAVQSPDGLFLQAYGVADPATGAAMTADMFQRVGSITKTFTGTLLLQLVAAGEVSLDDPVSRYVDGVPGGDEITLRMLATMTSGRQGERLPGGGVQLGDGVVGQRSGVRGLRPGGDRRRRIGDARRRRPGFGR